MPTIDWQTYVYSLWPVAVAILLGVFVRRAVLSLARRTHRLANERGEEPLYARIFEVIALPASVALPLFFLSIAIGLLPIDEEWVAHMRRWLGIAGMLCLTWLVVRAIGSVEAAIVRRHPADGIDDNVEARRVQTQARVFGRAAQILVIIVGVAIVLMTFPAIRQLGATLLASAGVLGIIGGLAAKPVFGNLIAGLQIAISQPIRLDDVIIINGDLGRVEEITSAYVVVRIWDERRVVVPLQWFIENPFENWTRTSAALTGTVILWLDYRVPMNAVRAELERICRSDDRWDGRRCVAQMTDAGETGVQVRMVVTARNSGDLFNLRCAVRERMVDFLMARHPEALPRTRATIARVEAVPDHEVRQRAEDRITRAAASTAGTGSPGPEEGSRKRPATEPQEPARVPSPGQPAAAPPGSPPPA